MGQAFCTPKLYYMHSILEWTLVNSKKNKINGVHKWELQLFWSGQSMHSKNISDCPLAGVHSCVLQLFWSGHVDHTIILVYNRCTQPLQQFLE
jgi:hypothetical protein